MTSKKILAKDLTIGICKQTVDKHDKKFGKAISFAGPLKKMSFLIDRDFRRDTVE